MKIILSNPKLINSARQLRDYLNDNTLTEFTVTTPEKLNPLNNVDISWGIKKKYDRVGLSTALLMSGVPSIDYNLGIPDVNKYPVVVRTILNSNQGNGIVIIKTPEEFEPYKEHYWSNWINFDFELGVHAINGEIVRVFKKICQDDEREFPIRNVGNNYKFSLRNIEKYKTLPDFISKLHEVLGFEICRYDIGWDSINKRYCCIEANTAPSLSNNFRTLEVYGNYYIDKLNLQRR